jgi:DNA-binding transcriptional LysR family regulator
MNMTELLSRSGISLERLRVFLQVADAGSMAQAAPDDPVRQSQFSRQLKELEIAFGAPLTKREGRRVGFNANGKRLAAILRAFSADLTGLQADMHSEPRSFALVAGNSVLDLLVAPRLTEVMKPLRADRLDLLPGRTREVVSGLEDGKWDFGVVRADAVPERLPSLPLGKLDYRLFYPRRIASPPEEKTKAWISWLGQLPLAMVAGEGRLRRTLDEAFARAGVVPKVISETGSVLQAATLVRSGHAAAILPTLMAGSFDTHSVGAVDLAMLKPVHRALALVWNPRAMERAGCEKPHLQAAAGALAIKA